MIVSVAIEKGGTGKSQTAVNLSCALVKFHKLKVLVVDLDPQGTASLGFGISPLSTDTNTIYDVLSGRVEAQDAVYSYNDSDLCIMPSNHELAIYGSNEFTTELDSLLSPMSNIFDFIFIDLPPTLGNFTMTALCLSDSVLIPVNASSSVCIVALLSQLRTIKTTVEAVNSKLSVLGILACMVNNTRICSEVLSWLEDEYPNLLFETKIRQNIKLAESLGLGEPIFDYAPDSYGALDYKNVAGEIMRRVTQVDLLRMVVKKRSEDNTRVKDSDSLSRFATRVAKLKGEGPLASSAEPEVTLEVISINIIDIEVPKNYVRKSLGDLSALVSSIKLYGIQQPIKVIKLRGTNKYRLVYGLRRLESAKQAGHDSVPCIVELVTIENRLQTLSMVENFARLSLNPIEQAGAFQSMGDKMTDELCRNVGKTSGYVQEAIGLLSLPESVQEEIMAEPDLYTWGILMVLIKAYGSSNTHGRKLFQAIATGKVNTAKEAEIFVQSIGQMLSRILHI